MDIQELNPDVLEHIFSFVEAKEVGNFRLVCKAWNEASLGVFRKRSIVKIRCCDPPLNWVTFDDEFQFVGPPFRRFELDSFTFRNKDSLVDLQCSEADDEVKERMASFWDEYGGHISHLKITFANVCCLDTFKRAIFEQTPNLEKLQLHLLRFDTVQAQQCTHSMHATTNANMKELKLTHNNAFGVFPLTMECILGHYVALEKLNITDVSVEIMSSLLNHYRHRDTEIPLKVLKLGDCMENHLEDLVNLLKLKLKLRKLKLRFDTSWYGQLQNNAYEKIMEYQGAFLVSFHLRTALHSCVDFTFHNGVYPLLSRLVLDGAAVRNFLFLISTPNLEILRIRANTYITLPTEEDLPQFGGTSFPLLKEFYYQHDRWITSQEMERIASLMPNVQRFYGFLDSLAFVVLCNRWNKLTRLVVDHFFHDERLLPVHYVGDAAIQSITNLQNLNTFKVMGAGIIGQDSLNAVLQLQKLKTLRMKPWIKSGTAYQKVERKFPGFDSAEEDGIRRKWW